MITYAINGAILEVKGEGAYSTEDVAATFAAAKNDPKVPLPILLLVDIRESLMAHSFSDISDRLALLEKQFGLIMAPLVAFVVSGVARDRLAQIYQSRAAETAEKIQVKVFTDPKAARDWLLGRKG